ETRPLRPIVGEHHTVSMRVDSQDQAILWNSAITDRRQLVARSDTRTDRSLANWYSQNMSIVLKRGGRDVDQARGPGIQRDPHHERVAHRIRVRVRNPNGVDCHTYEIQRQRVGRSRST